LLCQFVIPLKRYAVCGMPRSFRIYFGYFISVIEDLSGKFYFAGIMSSQCLMVDMIILSFNMKTTSRWQGNLFNGIKNWKTVRMSVPFNFKVGWRWNTDG
jgi:hypothetical protein